MANVLYSCTETGLVILLIFVLVHFDRVSSFEPCGNVGGKCRCEDSTADCSDTKGKLTFIPAFSLPVTTLLFSFNKLVEITSKNFFENVTELTELDISFNDLSSIAPGVFEVFDRLKVLRCTGDKLGDDALKQIFAIPALEVLDLTAAVQGSFPGDLIDTNSAPNLTTLILISNHRLKWLDVATFHALKNLKHLCLNYSKISTLRSNHMPSLEILEIRDNRLTTFPLTCADNGTSYYPRLLLLDVSENDIHVLDSSSDEPCLPKLRILKLYYNPMQRLDMAFFKTLDNLQDLIADGLGLQTITPDWLPSLRRLYIDYNKLTEFPVTCTWNARSFYPNLWYLNLKRNKLSYSLSPNAKWNVCLPALTELVISNSESGALNMSLFKVFGRLQTLHAEDGNINDVLPDYLPSLETLQLLRNKLSQMFDTCSRDGRSLFPLLSTLDLSKGSIASFEWQSVCPKCAGKLSCLPKLRSLNLEDSVISAANFGCAFSSQCLPALQTLNLKNTRIANGAFTVLSNPSLTTIDLSQNVLLDFAVSGLYPLFGPIVIREDVFAGCTNVVVLNVAGTRFRGISPEKLRQLFEPLVSLQELYLNDTNIDRITQSTFRALENIREIYLQQNKLSVIPDGAFDGLEHLLTLRLDGNSIFSISDGTFSPDTRRRLQSLSLHNNPFECTCSLLWFSEWMRYEPTVFEYRGWGVKYECVNVPGVDLASFFTNGQKCLLSQSACLMIITVTSLCILLLTSATLIYRCRWNIRLALYDMFHGDPQARWRHRRPEDFLYDLFVCYDGDDLRWVLDHLIPVLEHQMGLRLCVHQRDFLPGNNITDNILDSLSVSRRVLALFSPSLAKSEWCNFELEMCLVHVVEGDDVMVIVMLQEVAARDMSGAMRALMKTTTYIEWDDHPEAVASFWRRMTLALVDILPATRR